MTLTLPRVAACQMAVSLSGLFICLLSMDSHAFDVVIWQPSSGTLLR
jgi:hypothetical protein